MQIVVEVSDFLYKQILKRHVSSRTIAKIFEEGTVITEQSDAFNLSSFRRGMARAFEIMENIADKENEE